MLRPVVLGYVPVKPSDLDSTVALLAAETTAMRKLKGERDTEFVKRIVAAYLSADRAFHASRKRAK